MPIKRNVIKPLVSIIIVNYNGIVFIPKLLRSIKKQSCNRYEVLIVDNNSRDNSLEVIKQETEKLKFSHRFKILNLKRNVGFASANNRAAAIAKGEYLLFLNNDTTLHEDAIKEMVRTIQKDYFCAGVAPKMYLSRYLPRLIFDSLGICINNMGSPYNRGIGQIDLGQYDQVEEVMGVCYACCLVRKDIYRITGGLDNSYFAYFEDVDWCFRTRKSGYIFLSCPKAIVYHFHSGTTSVQSYAWKYYLIFRNYLRTATKTFGKRNSLRIITRKLRDILLTIVKPEELRPMRLAMFKVLANYLLIDWWVYGFKRIGTRRHFINEIPDWEIFAFGANEPSNFFNPKTYTSNLGMPMLDFIIKRKNWISPSNLMINKWNSLKASYYCSQETSLWNKQFNQFLATYFSPYRMENLSGLKQSTKIYRFQRK